MGGPQSTIFPIDDVLLPDVVTIPLMVALEAYDVQASALAAAVANEGPAIASLDDSAAAAPLAPTYPKPAVPAQASAGAATNAGR